MKCKRMILATLTTFIFVFLFEMIWHGFLMKEMYAATSSVWRPQAEQQMIYIFGGQLLFSLAMVFFYAQVGDLLPCKKGILFGLCTGLILSTPQLGSASYLPIPMTITLMWILGALIKCLGCGILISYIYRCCLDCKIKN